MYEDSSRNIIVGNDPMSIVMMGEPETDCFFPGGDKAVSRLDDSNCSSDGRVLRGFGSSGTGLYHH